MTEATKTLSEAIQIVSNIYGEEKFSKQMMGSMDDRVYVKDTAHLLAEIYTSDESKIYKEITQNVEEYVKNARNDLFGK